LEVEEEVVRKVAEVVKEVEEVEVVRKVVEVVKEVEEEVVRKVVVVVAREVEVLEVEEEVVKKVVEEVVEGKNNVSICIIGLCITHRTCIRDLISDILKYSCVH
jgi:hypothetical protein